MPSTWHRAQKTGLFHHRCQGGKQFIVEHHSNERSALLVFLIQL
jgi:hypothetical protein